MTSALALATSPAAEPVAATAPERDTPTPDAAGRVTEAARRAAVLALAGTDADPHRPVVPESGREAAYRLAAVLSARLDADLAGDTAAGAAARLEREAEALLCFLVERQAPDGRLDLKGCYSPNEAGFPVPALAAAVRHATGVAWFDPLRERLLRFLVGCGEAVLAGDAYTANHRWAAAAGPLAALHRIAPDDRYPEKIDAYLADGIDCSPDGLWYEERSPNYAAVANHGLLVLADAGHAGLLDHVVASTELSLAFRQPDGEADASFSHRQDRHACGRSVTRFRIARRVARLTGDGRFTALAESLWADEAGEPTGGDPLMPPGLELRDDPGPMPAAPPAGAEPAPVRVHLADAQIHRRSWGRTALTLAADAGGHFFTEHGSPWGPAKRSGDWFSLHHAGVMIRTVRLALPGGAAASPDMLTPPEDPDGAFELHGGSTGWDHPLDFRPDRPVIRMPHRNQHRMRVAIEPDALAVDLSCDSPDFVEASLNLHVQAGVRFSSAAGDAGTVAAGSQVAVRGSWLRLESDAGAIRVTGLPEDALPRHFPGTGIPDALNGCAGLLSLGLTFPVDLRLRFELL